MPMTTASDDDDLYDDLPELISMVPERETQGHQDGFGKHNKSTGGNEEMKERVCQMPMKMIEVEDKPSNTCVCCGTDGAQDEGRLNKAAVLTAQGTNTQVKSEDKTKVEENNKEAEGELAGEITGIVMHRDENLPAASPQQHAPEVGTTEVNVENKSVRSNEDALKILKKQHLKDTYRRICDANEGRMVVFENGKNEADMWTKQVENTWTDIWKKTSVLDVKEGMTDSTHKREHTNDDTTHDLRGVLAFPDPRDYSSSNATSSSPGSDVAVVKSWRVSSV
jgi:hypothetical protein